MWLKTLKKSLEELGFVPTKDDPCLFIHSERKLMVLVYVDDCLCFGKEDADLDWLVKELSTKHALGEEAMGQDVFAYLGIELDMSQQDQIEFVNGSGRGLSIQILLQNPLKDHCPSRTVMKRKNILVILVFALSGAFAKFAADVLPRLYDIFIVVRRLGTIH